MIDKYSQIENDMLKLYLNYTRDRIIIKFDGSSCFGRYWINKDAKTAYEYLQSIVLKERKKDLQYNKIMHSDQNSG